MRRLPAEPLTIGMFTDSYLPEINGVVTSLANCVRELRRRGHRVIIIAPSHERAVEEPDVYRFRSTPFPFYPQFRLAFPLPAKLLAELPHMPFDVIHAHSVFFIGCLGAFVAQNRKTPLVLTYHTLWTEYAHYIPFHQGITRSQAIWLSREFCNRCSGVITPTYDIRELLVSYGVVRPIAVIPSGVDAAVFASTVASAPRVRAGGRPIALFVGRLGKEKNIDLVFDAFDAAAARVPGLRLIVVGSGPYEETLRRRASELRHGARIEFMGSLDQKELGQYYAAADAFMFASTTETQGLVLLEAMTHGVPIAAVDCGVSREAVGDDAGLLVENTVDALSNAVVEIVTAGEADRARRIAAAKNAARPFAIENLVDQLEAHYAHVREQAAAAL
jgi:1,2-diacylglycerol 3-alpha-glucosyltransferase